MFVVDKYKVIAIFPLKNEIELLGEDGHTYYAKIPPNKAIDVQIGEIIGLFKLNLILDKDVQVQ